MRSSRRAARVVWLAAAAVALSCGSTPTSDGQPVTRQVITSEGGQASVSNGRFKILVPKDALKRDTAITILQVDAPVAGAVGPVYEVGPTGTVFQRPATLSFSFATLNVAAADVPFLCVATLWNGQWVPVASNVDRLSSVVTGQISHLSPWTLIVYTGPPPPEPDAGSDEPDGGVDPGDGGGDLAAGGQAGAHDGAAGTGGTTGSAGAGGKGGSTGSGGAGGTTGSGGKGGSGGAGGTTGAAGSGAGGTTGAAGAGGTSGQAGTTGQAGTSGAAGDSGGAGQGGAAGDTGQGGQSGQAGSGADDPSGAAGDDGGVDPDAV